jgi:hypothetical protein
MRTDEFEAASEGNLRRLANECFEKASATGALDKVRLLLEARFYLDEIDRRDDRFRSKRDLWLEIIVIGLILLEVVFALVGFREAGKQMDIAYRQERALKTLTDRAENQVSLLKSQKEALDESAAALKAEVEIAHKQETRTESELARRPDPKLWLYVNWEEYEQDRKGEALYKLRRRTGGEFTIALYLANEGLKPVEKPSLKLFYEALDEELSPVLGEDCDGGSFGFREPETSINVEDGPTVSLKTDSYKPLSQIKRSYRYFLHFKCPGDSDHFRLTVILEGNNIDTMGRTALVHLPPRPAPQPETPTVGVPRTDAGEVIVGQLEEFVSVGREIHGPPFLPFSRTINSGQ